jgi:uncharacterized protein with GYD domain
MSRTEVESLVVSMEARLSKYEKDLRKATAATEKAARNIEKRFEKTEGRLSTFGAGIGRMTTAFQALGAAVVGSQVTQGLRAVVSSVAELGRTSQTLGIPIEKLQALQAVAAGARVDAAGLKDMLQEFSAISSEAAQGQGDMYEILKANNVQLKDAQGNMRPVLDLLGEWADLIKNAKSEQDRLNLASVGFTDIGRALIPVLRGGADGLRAQMEAAGDLQGFLDQEMVNTAVALEKQMDSLGASFERAFKRGSISAISFILDMANAVEQASLAANAAISEATGGIIPNLTTNAAKSAVIERMATAERTGLFDTATGFEGFRGGAAAGAGKPTVLPAARNAGADAAANEAKRIRELIAALKFEASIRGMSEVTQETQRRLREAGAAATEEQRKAIIRLTAEEYAAAAAADRLKESQERLNEVVADFGAMGLNALDSFIIQGQTARDVMADLARTIASAALQAAILGQGPFASLFGTAPATSGGTGGLVGAIAGALIPRAAGGPVSPGKGYLVGESGPEMFLPRVGGRIAPNGSGASRVEVQVVPGEYFDARVQSVAGPMVETGIRRNNHGISSARRHGARGI